MPGSSVSSAGKRRHEGLGIYIDGVLPQVKALKGTGREAVRPHSKLARQSPLSAHVTAPLPVKLQTVSGQQRLGPSSGTAVEHVPLHDGPALLVPLAHQVGVDLGRHRRGAVA